MAFKLTTQETKNYDSIESLFRDIRTKKIDALYSHQADILTKYQKQYQTSKNVALELPTGSGKTLIGLLIAEYYRRIKDQKVIFLCSTKQLVNQVVELSNNKYGIKATAFIGSKYDYSQKDKSDYVTLGTVAVTTYSSLFNVNPFFQDPDIIILDDAHVAENYIASNWSLTVNRDQYPQIYKELLSQLKVGLEHLEFTRFNDDDIDPMEINTVQMIPTHIIYSRLNEIFEYLNKILSRESTNSLFYSWSNIKEHLGACQFYVSWKTILIRPIIPPTLKIPAFENAKQRVFMSATLGSSGDLERILGISKIDKIPLPDGWDKQGSGRRFFVFPELTLDSDGKRDLFVKANKLFDRSLSLVPDFQRLSDLQKLVENTLGYTVFDAQSIEKSKSTFTSTANAVALVANRYEGIDFEGDECRLLFIVNLSKTINLQETFLFQRMGSEVVLLDRIRTRITQAIGRCTRGASDYSCVVVVGEDLGHYFVSNQFRKYFHPEIQAEISFGIDQSKDQSLDDILENIAIFKDQDDKWRMAEKSIFETRNISVQETIPGSLELSTTAGKEVEFQYFMWDKDYEKATNTAQNVIDGLAGGKKLSGYRGYWNYMAAVASFLAEHELGLKDYGPKSRHYLMEASNCSRSISWLRKLITTEAASYGDVNNWDDDLIANIERLEEVFVSKGLSNTTNFEKELKEIEELLSQNEASKFERGQQKLGKYLGFLSDKGPNSGAPDPYWITNNRACIVFEDYTDSKGQRIPIAKARQAYSHPAWIKANINPSLEIFSVIITDSTTLDLDAKPFSAGVYYWNLGDFRKWSQSAIATIRNVRTTFVPGNEVWREIALDKFMRAKMDPKSIIEMVTKIPLENL